MLADYFMLLEPVFDAMLNIAFFLKDRDARCAMVNRTFARRCGHKYDNSTRARSSARRRRMCFRVASVAIYTAQDQAIIAQGHQLIDQLELHPGREPTWCMTCKQRLRDAAGNIFRLAGISRYLQATGTHPTYSRLAAVVPHIQENYVQPLNMGQLAQMANMSIAQLERYFHKIFHLMPRQVLLKTRLDATTALLVTHDKVTNVATLL